MKDRKLTDKELEYLFPMDKRTFKERIKDCVILALKITGYLILSLIVLLVLGAISYYTPLINHFVYTL